MGHVIIPVATRDTEQHASVMRGSLDLHAKRSIARLMMVRPVMVYKPGSVTHPRVVAVAIFHTILLTQEDLVSLSSVPVHS